MVDDKMFISGKSPRWQRLHHHEPADDGTQCTSQNGQHFGPRVLFSLSVPAKTNLLSSSLLTAASSATGSSTTGTADRGDGFGSGLGLTASGLTVADASFTGVFLKKDLHGGGVEESAIKTKQNQNECFVCVGTYRMLFCDMV